ncbi:glycine/sarcosine/betaine reductase selenoprotein B family protein [Desulforhopalus sp. 52FAK]
MNEESTLKESFEEFRKSFFYGSRSDMTFKFLDHLTDDEGSDLLCRLFRTITSAIDSGDVDQLKKVMIEGQSAAHAHPQNFIYDDGPFTPFSRKPEDAKFTMLTSSGHFSADNDPQPFGVSGMSQEEAESRIMDFLKIEPTLSEIPFNLSQEKLKVRHGGYDVTATQQDANVTFPWQRLVELEEEGELGSLTEFAYSFVGACSQTRLIKKVLPGWIHLMQENRIDGAILIPV